MKGIEIVVGGSVGHMSAFMAQTGCLVVCGDAGEALGDSIYEARLYVRGSVASLGADCIEKEMRDEHVVQVAGLLEAAGIDADAADFRRYGSARQLYTFKVDNAARVLMAKTETARPWSLRESYLFDRTVIAEIQRAATEGIYDIRGFGAKRRLPHFDDLLFLGASHLALPARGLPRALRDGRRPRHALRAQAARAEDPDHDRRDELRRALRAGEGGARPRRDGGRHIDDDRRRRHDARGARALEAARLPAPSLALRDESRRPAQGRRDRGRRRPGREAGRRRDAPGPQDLRPRRRDALAAEGHRPALRLASSGLDGAGRPRDQDPGAARDHRLGEARLRQGRRDADVLRRPARGEGGRGRDRRRRDAGRHRRDAGRLHRARRHPHASGDANRGRRAPGARDASAGAADRLGRDPEWGGRREGAGARRRRGLDRDRGARRDGGQRAGARRGVPRDRERRRASTTTGRPAAIRPGSRRRTPSSLRASTPFSEDGASPITSVSSRSRRRRSRVPAASHTSTTSSRRISSRSRSRPRRWRRCPSRAPTGSRARAPRADRELTDGSAGRRPLCRRSFAPRGTRCRRGRAPRR